jgi:hypothetical protein
VDAQHSTAERDADADDADACDACMNLLICNCMQCVSVDLLCCVSAARRPSGSFPDAQATCASDAQPPDTDTAHRHSSRRDGAVITDGGESESTTARSLHLQSRPARRRSTMA